MTQTNTMQTTKPQFKGCRFLKNGVKDATGKYYPCWYSLGAMVNGKIAITLYARSILTGLPQALQPENNSDMQSDYFENDKVRFYQGTMEFEALTPYAKA